MFVDIYGFILSNAIGWKPLTFKTIDFKSFLTSYTKVSISGVITKPIRTKCVYKIPIQMLHIRSI